MAPFKHLSEATENIASIADKIVFIVIFIFGSLVLLKIIDIIKSLIITATFNRLEKKKLGAIEKETKKVKEKKVKKVKEKNEKK